MLLAIQPEGSTLEITLQGNFDYTKALGGSPHARRGALRKAAAMA